MAATSENGATASENGATPAPRRVRFQTPSGPVSGLLLRPADARALLVLAHGAGAGMEHPFMEAVARLLAERGVATLRWQFPYMEAGSRRPDRPAVAVAAVRAAVAEGARLAAGAPRRAAGGREGDDRTEALTPLPMFAGGKSFGGRMTSEAQAEAPLPHVRGLVMLGFPLHAAKKPDVRRAEHLARIEAPMLFVQGTRDALADLDLLRDALARHAPGADVHVVEGADHAFHVLKRSGRTDEEALTETADAVTAWMRRLEGPDTPLPGH